MGQNSGAAGGQDDFSGSGRGKPCHSDIFKKLSREKAILNKLTKFLEFSRINILQKTCERLVPQIASSTSSLRRVAVLHNLRRRMPEVLISSSYVNRYIVKIIFRYSIHRIQRRKNIFRPEKLFFFLNCRFCLEYFLMKLIMQNNSLIMLYLGKSFKFL